MDKKNEMNIIKETCRTFMDNTSINGLKNILISKHYIIRVIWILVFMISTGLCMIMVITNCLNYLKYETKTVIREINEQQSDFPTVVLCSRNLFTTLYSYNFLKNYSLNTNQEDFFQNPDIRVIKSGDYLFKAFANYIKMNNNQLDIQKLDYTIKDILLSCDFNGDCCDYRNFDWYYHSTYGNCYTFNKNNSLKSYRPGKKSGLTLELYVGMCDELEKFSVAKGLAVIVYNNTSSNPFSADGVFVTTGQETNIIVKRNINLREPKPYSNCDIKNIKSDSFDSEFYKLIYSNTKNYNYKDCMDVCYEHYVVKHCNCYDHETFKYWNVDVCYTDENIKCLNQIFQNMSSSSNLNEYCYANCPLECDLSELTTTISTSTFPPSDYYLNQMRKISRLISKFSNISNVTDRKLQDSILKLSIFYDTLSYTLISESPTMGLVDLLSNLGGVLGLFLGISVISFAEVFELLFQVVFYFFTNRKTSKIESFVIQKTENQKKPLANQ